MRRRLRILIITTLTVLSANQILSLRGDGTTNFIVSQMEGWGLLRGSPKEAAAGHAEPIRQWISGGDARSWRSGRIWHLARAERDSCIGIDADSADMRYAKGWATGSS
jgi:hypothetical protein